MANLRSDIGRRYRQPAARRCRRAALGRGVRGLQAALLLAVPLLGAAVATGQQLPPGFTTQPVAPGAMAQQTPPSPAGTPLPSANAAIPPGGPAMMPPSANQAVPPGAVPAGTRDPATGQWVPAPPQPGAAPAAAQPELVVDVRIQGNKTLPLNKIMPHIRTRVGRPYDVDLLVEDVRRLDHTHLFVNVKTWTQQVAGGRIVIFDLLERPILREVKLQGCKEVHQRVLRKEGDVKVGDPADPFAIEEARRKMEEFYHSKGFTGARVTLLEGDKPDDRRAYFLINEGVKQKVWKTQFIGNTIADDGRLRTQISTKSPFLFLFGGEFDRKKADEDVEKLTAYYRGLGYFRARIGTPILEYNDKENWVTVTFVIDEGPRYLVRTTSVLGNKKYSTDELMAELKLKSNEYYNQAKVLIDQSTLKDKYGSVGYVFAVVDAEPRMDENTNQLDLVYSIKEGDPYRVGRINVQIKGEYPHTLITTVLNRLSLHPGDLIDIREIRASERRLKLSQLFEANAATGKVPKISFSPPGQENSDDEDSDKPDADKSKGGRKRGGFRSQSPDPPQERFAEITIDCGQYIGPRNLQEEPPAYQTSAPAVTQQPAAHTGGPVAAGESPAQTSGRIQVQPSPTAENDQLAQTAYELSMAALENRTQQQSRARLIPTQLYQPASGQLTPAAQYPPPAPNGTGTAPAASNPPPANYAPPPGPAPQGYAPPYAAQPAAPAAVAPMQPAAPTQAAPVQPAPAYGQDMWNRQAPGPDRPVMTPQGPAAPGPIFSESSPFRGGPPGGGTMETLPFTIQTEEAMTGRLQLGVGINSDAGLVGSLTLDEQNFDWTRWPSSWEDIRDGTAFRGAGQRFRIQAMPGIATIAGTQPAQQYSVTFQDPYMFDTQVSLGLMGFYYDRIYTEYTDQRLGGRIALGYQLTPDFSATVAYRGQSIRILNPIDPALSVFQGILNRNLASHGFALTLTENKRDSDFMPTEGYFVEANFEEVLGSFQYPHAELDARKYFTLFQRPDCSGRQVLTVAGRVGFTGDNTPIYDRYYIGGFSTLRGFQFRGASPSVIDSAGQTVMVGGDFEVLGSIEYNYPITADDMLRGVVFCDTGTVEPSVSSWTNAYRVAPGFGLRICVPAMGPAPIALDFAFPVAWQHGDRQEMFSFFMGINR
jgi:outer membrane protein insertion porin family